MLLSQQCQLQHQTHHTCLKTCTAKGCFISFSDTICHRFSLNLIAYFRVLSPVKVHLKPMLHKHPSFLGFIYILIAGSCENIGKCKVNLEEILGYSVFPVNGEGLLCGLTSWGEYFKFESAQSRDAEYVMETLLGAYCHLKNCHPFYPTFVSSLNVPADLRSK